MNIRRRLLSVGALVIMVSYADSSNDVKGVSMISHLNKENAEQTISACSKAFPVIIKFSAQWCGPCKQMAPVFAECASTNWNGIYFCCEADFDQLPELAKKYEISAIPTFVVVYQDTMLGKVSGLMSKDELLKRIDEVVHPADLSKLSTQELNERLMREVTSGTVDSMKKLIDAGAQVNATCANGTTPLVMAICMGAMRVDGVDKVKLLLESGAALTFPVPGQPDQQIADMIKGLISNTQVTLDRQKMMLSLVEAEQAKKITGAAAPTLEGGARSCEGGVCTIS